MLLHTGFYKTKSELNENIHKLKSKSSYQHNHYKTENIFVLQQIQILKRNIQRRCRCPWCWIDI